VSIKIKVGKFVKEHINNIVEYCNNHPEEISNLSTNKFGLSYPFLALINTISEGRQRYWKDEYDINGKRYRFCSEFGGSRTDSDNKTLSEKHGNAFLEYLNSKNLLLDKYKDNDIKFIVNRSFSDDELKCYENIARKYNLRSHCSSGKKYFQIYPKNTSKVEGTGGCHYEFEIQKNQNILLVLHFENQIKFKKQLKNKIINLFEDKKIPRIDITTFTCVEIEKTFEKLYKKVELAINEFYLEENKTTKKGKKMDNPSGKIALNQILYGPPGTGKTYQTINKALEIIFKAEDSEKQIQHKFNDFELNKSVREINKVLNEVNHTDLDRKILTTAFDYYSSEDKGQVLFVTFHQSYGYEEFVEGIKAIPPNKDENSEMIYDVCDGIFKNISNLAKENFKISSLTNTEEISVRIIFEKKLDVFKDKIEDLLDKNEKIEIENKSIHISNIEKDRLTYTGSKNEWKSGYYLKFSDLYEMYKNNIQSLKDISKLLDISKTALHHKGYYFEIFKKFKSLTEDIKFNDTELKDNKPRLKNYILIIDEINRGNISKIFGELITLIEESKRMGAGEELKIILPYSTDKFGVPSNLYIIGTMNTADRSIAPIDTALRRRFDFVEIPPEPILLKIELDDAKINLQELLTAINIRIAYIYDRDHTIGHSYFMGIKTLADLKEVFKNNIIPLLAEYFHEDWKNIKLILNDKDGKFIETIKDDNNYLSNISNQREQIIYRIADIDEFDECPFMKIYNTDCKNTSSETTEDTNAQSEE